MHVLLRIRVHTNSKQDRRLNTLLIMGAETIPNSQVFRAWTLKKPTELSICLSPTHLIAYICCSANYAHHVPPVRGSRLHQPLAPAWACVASKSICIDLVCPCVHPTTSSCMRSLSDPSTALPPAGPAGCLAHTHSRTALFISCLPDNLVSRAHATAP